jgi:type III secretion protein S
MDAINLFHRALVLIVILSAPPLMVATVIGVGVSVVQTLFQIQDQTLPFFIKLVAVSITLALTVQWMQSEILLLANQVFITMGSVRL